MLTCRSSHQRRSLTKGVSRNFVKFIGKHLWCCLFFNKVTSLRPATILKKTLAQVFSCEFCEISKNIFFKEHLCWLLLSIPEILNNISIIVIIISFPISSIISYLQSLITNVLKSINLNQIIYINLPKSVFFTLSSYPILL